MKKEISSKIEVLNEERNAWFEKAKGYLTTGKDGTPVYLPLDARDGWGLDVRVSQRLMSNTHCGIVYKVRAVPAATKPKSKGNVTTLPIAAGVGSKSAYPGITWDKSDNERASVVYHVAIPIDGSITSTDLVEHLRDFLAGLVGHRLTTDSKVLSLLSESLGLMIKLANVLKETQGDVGTLSTADKIAMNKSDPANIYVV